MDKNKPVCFFNSDEIDHFERWIELNVNNITWEGRYINEFENFWSKFFESDNHLRTYMDKIRYANEYVKVGPLVSWFNWLEEKLICFCFVFKNVSVYQLSLESGLPVSEIATALRVFFVERLPHLEEEINEFFANSNAVSDNIYLKYSDFEEKLNMSLTLRGCTDGETMRSLEVTLYDEWKKLYDYILNEKGDDKFDFEKIKEKENFKSQLNFVKEFVILLLVGAALILALRSANQWYEGYLVKQITLFDSNFFWLDKTLNYEDTQEEKVAEVDVNYQDLEELEKIENQSNFDDNVEYTRYDVESEVSVTSLDNIPKSFRTASLESSSYEEKRKGGYRDSRFGRRKAYRIMINTVHPERVKGRVTNLIDKYQVKPVSTVKPGTNIPGGIYFNLYVPRKHLGEILGKISIVEDATILESNTRFGAPSGMNKVFIWIKSI
jgi:hypothetical protein